MSEPYILRVEEIVNPRNREFIEIFTTLIAISYNVIGSILPSKWITWTCKNHQV